jgi:MFS family permease
MADRIDRKRLFTGCVVSLVATAFGFAVRAAILGDWRAEFNLSQEQIGYLLGAGLFPFAISIILFSLIVDRIGNGISMAIAFTLHVASAIITLAAPFALAGPGASPEEVAAGQKVGFALLYIGTFIFALGNGTVEAVVNPVTATLYDREKTRYLNILHAGWPGGLVLGGLLAIAVSMVNPDAVPGSLWQWQMGLVLLPTLAYGVLLFRQHFPVQERVAANVPYFQMLREFGAGSCFVVSFFLFAGLNQILVILGVPSLGIGTQAALALVPTVLFAVFVRSFGRPMFVLLLLVMVLLATTELGTDSWIADIMRTVLGSPTLGTLFLVWTSLIMFVLRFFAGPIVDRITPLGLLAASALVGAVGLYWLAQAGSGPGVLFVAASFYGLGKTFFWPTTLGVVSEQYPKGGALMLNAIAGVGMISVGTLGNPAIGAIQDNAITAEVRAADPLLADQVIGSRPGLFGESFALDPAKRTELTSQLAADPQNTELQRQVNTINDVEHRTKQGTLGKIAVLPAIMLLCYLTLILYFKARGGYRPEHLTARSPAHVGD